MSKPGAFTNNDYCFACGTRNPLGLRLVFQELAAPDGTRLLSTRVTPSPHWQGFQGVLHGGLQSTILDDLMSNHLVRIEQVWAATVELTLRFRRPVPLDRELVFTSRVASHHGRVWVLSGECCCGAEDGAEALTSAEGRFIELKPGAFGT